MMKILKLMLVIMKEYQKKKFVVKIIKNTVPWTYVVSDLNDEKIVETFYEKQLQKIIQKEFRDKK